MSLLKGLSWNQRRSEFNKYSSVLGAQERFFMERRIAFFYEIWESADQHVLNLVHDG